MHSTNLFLESILSSLNSAVIVVDNSKDHLVLIWNEQSEDMWGLRFEEVIGLPLKHLDIGLPIDEVLELIKAPLGEEVRSKIVKAVNRRGRHIECRIRATALSADRHSPGAVLLTDEHCKKPND